MRIKLTTIQFCMAILIALVLGPFTSQADNSDRKKQLIEMIEKTPEGPIRNRIRQTLDAILDREQLGLVECESLLEYNVTVLYPVVPEEPTTDAVLSGD